MGRVGGTQTPQQSVRISLPEGRMQRRRLEILTRHGNNKHNTEAAHLCLTLMIAVYSLSYGEFSERRFHIDFRLETSFIFVVCLWPLQRRVGADRHCFVGCLIR